MMINMKVGFIGSGLNLLSGSSKPIFQLMSNLEKIKIADNDLKRVWGGQLTRILLRSNVSTVKDSWTIRIVP